VSQVKDSDNPASLILAETLLELDSVFIGRESQHFLGSPLTLQIWLMERLDMIAMPTLLIMVLAISSVGLPSKPSIKLKVTG